MRIRAAGFTIVEVIVALTLLGITTVAVFGGLQTCAAATHHSRMLMQSVLLAEQLLTEAMLEQNPAFRDTQGVNGLYSWNIHLVPTSIEGLGAVHVQVTWPEQGRFQQYDLVSLMSMKPMAESYE